MATNPGEPNGRYRSAAQAASRDPAGQSSASKLGAYSSLANAYQPPAPTLESAGIRAGEIVAYRAWRIGDDGLLRGIYRTEFVWRPWEIVRAERLQVGHGEGVHAYKSLANAIEEWGFVRPSVFGEVYLWGEVIEYERGWKAEFASVRKLVEVREDGISHLKSWFGRGTLARLKELYGA